ncbi:MAG: Stp1/IreP family PP2C-type Ser/Thr phosphatase [Acidobacteriaceae bacterium]
MATITARNLEVAGYTDRGRVRRSNEDACGFHADAGLFVVCDGMGGAAAGEVASHLAVESFIQYGCEHRAESASSEALLREAVLAANGSIYQRAQQQPELEGMGTTLVALLLEETEAGTHVWVAHAGDSRCYRLRAGKLQQLTLDHSLVEEQVRMGRLTRREAERSPYRAIITRAVGTKDTVEPDILHEVAETDDLYLLCSDGLTRELKDDEICKILLAEPEAQPACVRLVARANARGGHDNTTVLLVRVK